MSLFNRAKTPCFRRSRWSAISSVVLGVVWLYPCAVGQADDPVPPWQIAGLKAVILDRDPRLLAAAVPLEIDVERIIEAMGAAAKDYIPQLIERFGDPDADVRYAAVEALGAMGRAAGDHARLLAGWLGDQKSDLRVGAARALALAGPIGVNIVPAILTHGYRNNSRISETRFLAYFVTGGDERAVSLLFWLDAPNQDPVSQAKQTPEYARRMLQLFLEVWPETGLALQTAARLNPIDVAVDVEPQKNRWMVR